MVQEPVFARPSGVLSLKTNLLEVLEDHMCVVCINPIPASDFEQVSENDSEVFLCCTHV